MDHYKYFIEIARLQSIQAASDHLFVTPSALSKYVQRLEKRFGVLLFERVGKKFILTYAGNRYLEWCIKQEQLSKACEADMGHIVQEGRKKLRIGFPFMRMKQFVTHILPEFCLQFPNIDMSIFERNSESIWPMFFNHELDVVFMYKDPSLLSDSIRYEVLSQEQMVLCVSREHPILQEAQTRIGFDYPWVDIRHLAEDKLIVMTSSAQDTVGATEEFFRMYISDPHIYMRAMSYESIAIAVSQNMGISILADHMVDLLGYGDRIVKLSFGDRPIDCCYRAFYRNSPSTLREIKSLISIAQKYNSH